MVNMQRIEEKAALLVNSNDEDEQLIGRWILANIDDIEEYHNEGQEDQEYVQ